jgi:uncharacterized protein (DUF2336 family)
MSNLFNQSIPPAYKSGDVNPILAQLYLSYGISDGAMGRVEDAERAGLCNDIIQLIETSASQKDREIASEILISLLKHAEKNLKQAIAERFANIDTAPLRVILQFVHDDIDVATPVLKYSHALNDLDLMYIIQSRDSPFWQVIANRENLPENVVETLVDTKDIPTAKNLIQNETVRFSEYAAEQIVYLANKESVLVEALINRGLDKEGAFAQKIYSYASESLKLAIIQKCGRLSEDSAEKLEEIFEEFTEATPRHFMPTAAMTKAADLFQEQGKLVPSLMVNTLKRGQISSFIAQFSKYINMPVAVVVPMLQQRNGQGLSIAAKANEISRNDFLVIFNFTRKMMGENYLSSKDVASALAHYDRISPDVAKRLMNKTRH